MVLCATLFGVICFTAFFMMLASDNPGVVFTILRMPKIEAATVAMLVSRTNLVMNRAHRSTKKRRNTTGNSPKQYSLKYFEILLILHYFPRIVGLRGGKM